LADIKETARRRVLDAQDRLFELSRWMYENPETAYEERRSSARLAQFLEEAGFTVEIPAYGLETAFVARAGASGPQVVVCAEYDALPGVGHACGHNIIATAALGAGLALLPLTDELGFRLTILGTPAEEHYPTDKVHGIIVEGGDAPNIIPEYTRSSWYVRAENRRRLDALLPQVVACFEGAATATGCKVEIEHVGHIYDELISNRLLTELYAANSAALGRPMLRGDSLPPSQSGSTDMGNVSHLVPTIHPMLSIDSLPAVNHQKEFAAHTVTPQGEKAIVDGAVTMAWTIIDLAEGDRWSEL
jgi:metal-dependent amidase/aminoacylase/carboxypeptidase family protein